jgi:hypothetical protein
MTSNSRKEDNNRLLPVFADAVEKPVVDLKDLQLASEFDHLTKRHARKFAEILSQHIADIETGRVRPFRFSGGN